MSWSRLIRSIALATALLPGTVATVAGAMADPDVVPGRYIVLFRDDVADPVAGSRALGARHGVSARHVYARAIKGMAVDASADTAARLRGDSDVRAVVPDRRVRADVADKGGQEITDNIRRVGADRSTTAAIDGTGRGLDVDVAVLDTGIDPDHPDLDVVRSFSCLGTNGDDRNGHGTHVAGIAAARDNQQGVVGVAPGARIWSVQVLDQHGEGFFSDFICGVDFVTRHAGEIEVANMSLSGTGADDGNCGRTNTDPLHEAICRSVAAGVTYVVSAGNSGADAALRVPAAYPEVITVSALVDTDGLPGGLGAGSPYGADDTFLSLSSFGSVVDIAAPGWSVRSTYRNGSYARLSGTSQAAPHVAGAAALLQARQIRRGQPRLAPSEVRQRLVSLGENLGRGHTDPSGKHPEPVLRVERI